jgi:hypothetical protein
MTLMRAVAFAMLDKSNDGFYDTAHHDAVAGRIG